LYDYEQAITDRTAALLRVHPSNFRIDGFTYEVSVEEMVALGKKHGMLVLDDLGSGCFLDTSKFGLALEPTVQNSLNAGVSLAFFSGDKLVGGPQAGIVVGKKDLVKKLAKHPLARAVRIDKVRIAGLVATLIHYLKGEAIEKIPIWRMISIPLPEVDRRAKAWVKKLGTVAEVVDGETMVGGGSLPGNVLPTKLVSIRAKSRTALIGHKIAQRIRQGSPAVIGRVNDDVLFLDPRSVLPEDDSALLGALTEVLDAIG
jgi:L-seryl-tRNA(Ser) seleniumtransferase